MAVKVKVSEVKGQNIFYEGVSSLKILLFGSPMSFYIF